MVREGGLQVRTQVVLRTGPEAPRGQGRQGARLGGDVVGAALGQGVSAELECAEPRPVQTRPLAAIARTSKLTGAPRSVLTEITASV